MSTNLAFWMSDAPIILAALIGAILYILGDHHDKSNA